MHVALALALAFLAATTPPSDRRRNGEPIYSLAFSADGQRLLAATPRMVIVLDVASGRVRRTWRLRSAGHEAWFLPAGRVLTAGSDHRAQIWNAETGALQQSLRTRQGPFALSPDGRRLAASRRSDVEPTPEVVLVNLDTGQEERRIRTAAKGDVYALAFSPDGAVLAGVGIGGRPCPGESLRDCQNLWTWDVLSGRRRSASAVRGDIVDALAFSPDGTLLAMGSGNPGAGEIQIWSAGPARALRSWTVKPDRVYALAFSPDGRTLFTGGRFLTTMAWDPRTGRLVHRFPRIMEKVVSLAVSPDGRFLAQGSGGRESRIALWDLATFRRVW